MTAFLRRLFTNRFIKDVLLIAVLVFILYVITHNPIVRPMPKPSAGNWSIQLMQHPLLFGFAGHNYLALRNADGAIVSELHGLATDTRTNTWKYVGSRETDLLKVWEFESGKYLASKTYPGIILMEGDEKDVVHSWALAMKCKGPINDRNISYPPYGVSFKTETINSNSVAYTLAQCMNLDTQHVGIWTPGSTKNLLDSR